MSRIFSPIWTRQSLHYVLRMINGRKTMVNWGMWYWILAKAWPLKGPKLSERDNSRVLPLPHRSFWESTTRMPAIKAVWRMVPCSRIGLASNHMVSGKSRRPDSEMSRAGRSLLQTYIIPNRTSFLSLSYHPVATSPSRKKAFHSIKVFRLQTPPSKIQRCRNLRTLRPTPPKSSRRVITSRLRSNTWQLCPWQSNGHKNGPKDPRPIITWSLRTSLKACSPCWEVLSPLIIARTVVAKKESRKRSRSPLDQRKGSRRVQTSSVYKGRRLSLQGGRRIPIRTGQQGRQRSFPRLSQ